MAQREWLQLPSPASPPAAVTLVFVSSPLLAPTRRPESTRSSGIQYICKFPTARLPRLHYCSFCRGKLCAPPCFVSLLDMVFTKKRREWNVISCLDGLLLGNIELKGIRLFIQLKIDIFMSMIKVSEK